MCSYYDPGSLKENQLLQLLLIIRGINGIRIEQKYLSYIINK